MTLRIVPGVREAFSDARVLAGAGLLRPVWPDVVMRGALAVARHGVSPAAAYEYAAARFDGRTAVIDERGSVSFSDLARRISQVAEVLEDLGIASSDRIGVLCRNHREFIEILGAASSLGADVVLLNVSFAAPQLSAVLRDEGVTALVYDQDLGTQARAGGAELRRFVAWDPDRRSADPRVDDMHSAHRRRFPVATRVSSRFVLLTSGTTGRPRGTDRHVPLSLDPLVAVLSRVPIRSRDVVLIASPLFHAWGFGNLGLGMVLSWTVVLRRRFDPESILEDISEHRVRVLVTVPLILQRLLELPASTRRRYDLSSLEVVMSSGSQLSGRLARRFMDHFGEILFNVYGSTEAAFATIATPADLRAAPNTAGLAPPGSEVRIADDEGAEVPTPRIGRVLVRNKMLATSRSPDRNGRLSDGFLPTGDLGHKDELGRLYIDGREDDMIISGGENVYPQEVEDLLVSHPAIVEAAVVGVPDPEYGQRLRALVVLKSGSELSGEQVRDFVRQHLARYKVPREVRFVAALRRNETGKLLHKVPRR